MTVSLTNGDGTAGAGTTTTLQATDTAIFFDTSRTYSVSATGRSTRWTKFGTLVDGTKDSGKQSVLLVSGAAINIGGNVQMYGSTIKTQTGALTLAPGTTGLTYSLINCILQSANTTNLGLSSGSIDTAYNVDIIAGTASVGALGNFLITDAERITVALSGTGINHIRTGASFTAKDVVFIGTPVQGQLRFTGGTSSLIAPTWDQNFKIVDSTNSGTVNEYWFYGILALDSNANPIEGLPFTLEDAAGNVVIDTTTNSNGKIVYGSGALANQVNVVTYSTQGSVNYKGPFTARLNQGGSAIAGYPARTVTFDWRTVASWDVESVQYADLFDIMQLGTPAGNPTNWTECEL